MPVVYPIPQFQGFPTLFGDIRDTNVTFVVDTSESMQANLTTVKYHLMETLLAQAYNTNHSRFNIVEFSNKVTKWCDRIVTCSPQTVSSAMQWIQSLTCTLGRDLLGALTAAFDDPVCQAIYLVTNGLPDNTLKDIFHVIPYISRSRPIHTFYLSGKWIDSESREFLQGLGRLTRGSAHLIRLDTCGDIKQVIPVYPADLSTSGPLYSDLKYCSVKTALDNNAYIGSWAEGSDPKTFHMQPVSVYSPLVTAGLVSSFSVHFLDKRNFGTRIIILELTKLVISLIYDEGS
uniref:von Willebrand factor A domain-containing protein 3A-like n=1 Tax=Pristiophorus japonicus TaxID=55135 RepID=UPI00398EA2AE